MHQCRFSFNIERLLTVRIEAYESRRNIHPAMEQDVSLDGAREVLNDGANIAENCAHNFLPPRVVIVAMTSITSI